MSDTPQNWNNLEIFQHRIAEILRQGKLSLEQERCDRHVLEMSFEAKHEWVNFRNYIEENLRPGGYFSDIDDAASKAATNAARMAALFHHFEGFEGDISGETMMSAINICTWYLNEFKRLFSPPPEIPLDIQDANLLEQWLYKWSVEHPSNIALAKSLISQYGPNPLRVNKERRELTLNLLVSQNKIRIIKIDKKNWVYLNPNCFPIPRTNENVDIFLYQPLPV